MCGQMRSHRKHLEIDVLNVFGMILFLLVYECAFFVVVCFNFHLCSVSYLIFFSCDCVSIVLRNISATEKCRNNCGSVRIEWIEVFIIFPWNCVHAAHIHLNWHSEHSLANAQHTTNKIFAQATQCLRLWIPEIHFSGRFDVRCHALFVITRSPSNGQHARVIRAISAHINVISIKWNAKILLIFDFNNHTVVTVYLSILVFPSSLYLLIVHSLAPSLAPMLIKTYLTTMQTTFGTSFVALLNLKLCNFEMAPSIKWKSKQNDTSLQQIIRVHIKPLFIVRTIVGLKVSSISEA